MTNTAPRILEFSKEAIEGAERRFPDGCVDVFLSSDFSIDCSNVALLDELAKGSFGIVYRGIMDGETYGVKIIDFNPNIEEQINVIIELTMLQSLPHERLVKFKGAGYLPTPSTGAKIMIVMELCNYGALRECLKLTIPWPLRVRLALEIAQGLEFLHGLGVIHRDVKTTNVLIDIDWHAKLCDFSFACHEECTNKKDYIYGTEEFMSPEMALAMDFDKSSDIFSYGIMLCELITGIEPSKTFLHRRPQDLFEMNEQEVRDAVPEECPEALEALALQCCDSEPSKRPSAATCVEELTALLEELGGAENILDFQPDHLPQPLVLSSLSPMREGNVITPATPAAEYNLRRPSAMTTFMGYDQRRTPSLAPKVAASPMLALGVINKEFDSRFAYLELQMQELRAENKRLTRELHAMVVLSAEKTPAPRHTNYSALRNGGGGYPYTASGGQRRATDGTDIPTYRRRISEPIAAGMQQRNANGEITAWESPSDVLAALHLHNDLSAGSTIAETDEEHDDDRDMPHAHTPKTTPIGTNTIILKLQTTTKKIALEKDSISEESTHLLLGHLETIQGDLDLLRSELKGRLCRGNGEDGSDTENNLASRTPFKQQSSTSNPNSSLSSANNHPKGRSTSSPSFDLSPQVTVRSRPPRHSNSSLKNTGFGPSAVGDDATTVNQHSGGTSGSGSSNADGRQSSTTGAGAGTGTGTGTSTLKGKRVSDMDNVRGTAGASADNSRRDSAMSTTSSLGQLFPTHKENDHDDDDDEDNNEWREQTQSQSQSQSQSQTGTDASANAKKGSANNKPAVDLSVALGSFLTAVDKCANMSSKTKDIIRTLADNEISKAQTTGMKVTTSTSGLGTTAAGASGYLSGQDGSASSDTAAYENEDHDQFDQDYSATANTATAATRTSRGAGSRRSYGTSHGYGRGSRRTSDISELGDPEDTWRSAATSPNMSPRRDVNSTDDSIDITAYDNSPGPGPATGTGSGTGSGHGSVNKQQQHRQQQQSPYTPDAKGGGKMSFPSGLEPSPKLSISNSKGLASTAALSTDTSASAASHSRCQALTPNQKGSSSNSSTPSAFHDSGSVGMLTPSPNTTTKNRFSDGGGGGGSGVDGNRSGGSGTGGSAKGYSESDDAPTTPSADLSASGFEYGPDSVSGSVPTTPYVDRAIFNKASPSPFQQENPFRRNVESMENIAGNGGGGGGGDSNI